MDTKHILILPEIKQLYKFYDFPKTPQFKQESCLKLLKVHIRIKWE